MDSQKANQINLELLKRVPENEIRYLAEGLPWLRSKIQICALHHLGYFCSNCRLQFLCRW